MIPFTDPTTTSDEKAHENLDIRVQPGVKASVAQAAKLQGVKVSTFVRAAIAREANRVLQDHQHTVLTAPDHETFLAALDAPPAPTDAAVAAVSRYRRRIQNAD